MRTWWIGPSLLVVSLLARTAPVASAQGLSERTTDRCVRAAVKIVVEVPGGGGTSTGSGTIIDPRGYVLTNFHVVGHVNAQHGVPGTLIDPSNRVVLGSVSNARESAAPRWVGTVVRADARLDLALVRIVGDVNGQPVRGPFPSIPIAGTDRLRPGSRVFAFGYPLGVRTINVTGGQVTGFEMNARDEVAWIRADAEFNPGNSGGMLVDERGRLIGIPTSVVHGQSTLEPIELARPAERIPAEWRAALRRGHIDDVRIDGVPTLTDGVVVSDTAVGDMAGLGPDEIHFYVIADDVRPGAITLTGSTLEMAVADSDGRILRRGRGRVDVGPGDPPSLLLAVLVPGSGQEAVSYQLRADRVRPVARDQVAYRPPPPPPGPAPMGPPRPAGPLPNPFAGPPMAADAPYLPPPSPASAPPYAQQPPAGYAVARATVRGSVLDAVTGGPVAGGMVIIGRPGMDLGRHIQLYLENRMSDEQFFAVLAGFARTDASGRYQIENLPTNQAYPAAGFAQGYRPQMLRIGVGTEGAVLELNPIRLPR